MIDVAAGIISDGRTGRWGAENSVSMIPGRVEGGGPTHAPNKRWKY